MAFKKARPLGRSDGTLTVSSPAAVVSGPQPASRDEARPSERDRARRARTRLSMPVLAELLQGWSAPAGRIALGVIYLWFGLLKAIGMTPVEGLITRLVPFLNPGWFIPALGVWEIVVGLGFLANRFPRLILVLFGSHLLGTFGVLILLPDVAYQDGNPLMLTVEGEFVIKNLALIALGLMVAGNQLGDASGRRACQPVHRS